MFTGVHYRYHKAANRLLQRNETGQSLPEPKANIRYEYNDAGRQWRYYEADTLIAEYIYNAGGQRTRKILYDEEGAVTQTIIYHWAMGMLVEETTATGEFIRDYIYGTSYMPVAQVDVHQSTDGDSTEQVSYLYADHLDTPRLATAANGAVVWRWDSDAFGEGEPVSTATTGQQDTVINLRLPGQYYDAETKFYYNFNRYYELDIGRYVSSDKMGLRGGYNTYLYADANPIMYFDSLGLITERCARKLRYGDEQGPANDVPTSHDDLERHDYLVVDGTVYSFGKRKDSSMWDGDLGEIRSDNENPGKSNCKIVCNNPKFDIYVKQAVSIIGERIYSVFPEDNEENCQTWTSKVIAKAFELFREKEKCEHCMI